jgi:hypothetical protein
VVGEHFIPYFLDYDYEAPTKKEMAAMRIIEFKIKLICDFDSKM